jgi:hypothetical protein
MRAFLSSGSHLMARGLHDMGLQSQLEQVTATQQQQQQQQQLSAYVRSALQSCVLQAYCEYQRQLWCPDAAVAGSEHDDIGYCSGGAAVDSAAPSKVAHSSSGSSGASLRDHGQWHFHTYGDAVGLFVMDVHHSSSSASGAMRTQASAPMLCSKQWASIAAVLQLPQLRVLCLVSALPFATASLSDVRFKARHPSMSHLRYQWEYHAEVSVHILRNCHMHAQLSVWQREVR